MVRLRFVPVALVCLFVAGAASPTNVDSGRWWHADRTIARLGLSVSQRQAIDRIYNLSFEERAACAARVARAHARLDSLLMSDRGESEVLAAAAEAAAAEGARGRARTLMLYHIMQVLTPDQRAVVPALLDDEP